MMNSCLYPTRNADPCYEKHSIFFDDQYKYIHVTLNITVITTNHAKTMLVFCLAFLPSRVSFSELCSVVASRARPLADRVSTDPREAPPSPRPPPPRTFSPKNPRQPRPYSAWSSACKFGSGQNWQKVGRVGVKQKEEEEEEGHKYPRKKSPWVPKMDGGAVSGKGCPPPTSHCPALGRNLTAA